MAATPETNAEERVETECGLPPETTAYVTRSGSGYSTPAFHTDPDCPRMELADSRAGPRETTVATAEDEGREQCGTCAGGNHGGGPATLYLQLTGQGEYADDTDDSTERTSDTAHTPDDDD